MGNYKIPQDVEAEDKLIGPFTFRQFIFLLIAAAAVFVGWLLTKINVWLVSIPLPIFLFFGFLGVYRREDQPVEIYLMAALNYFLKPRRRTWDPEGVTENVKLTAPPRQAAPKLKHLEKEERGQLAQLAHVMDTRGWSTKRPELNEASNRESISVDDRLVSPLPPKSDQEPLDVHSSDDLLDPVNFPDAKRYRELAESSSKEARKKAIAGMRQATVQSQEPGVRNEKAEGSGPKAQTKNPVSLKYQPYPVETKQTKLDPETGRFSERKTVVQATSRAAGSTMVKPHLRLANEPSLSVQHIAQQAERIAKSDGKLVPGQEIDLPNRGEQLA